MGYPIITWNSYLENETDIYLGKCYVDGVDFLHAHDFIEIAYVTSGSGTHKIGCRTDEIHRGDMFIVNAYVPHQYISDKSDPLTVYNCIFIPSAIDGALTESDDFIDVAYNYLFHSFLDEEHKSEYIALHNMETSAIESLLDEMYSELHNKKNCYTQIMRLDLIKLLILTFRIYKDDSRQNHNQQFYKKLVVESTLRFMREHSGEDIKIEKLSELSYLSPSYFSRIFKEITGMTVIKALQKIRIEKACELLTSTNFSVAEVAEMSGYSDIKHFYQLFSQEKSVSPGKYRKDKIKNAEQKPVLE